MAESSDKKKMIRFRQKDDISLLKEVLEQNPFQTPSNWANVAESLAAGLQGVTARRCRERTDLLLSYYRSHNSEMLKK